MTIAGPLEPPWLSFVTAARSATLGTIAPNGTPRLVPICFVIAASDGDPVRLFSPIDEKPKATADPRGLARVRDIVARPHAALLVDRWSEAWDRLGWVRLECSAAVVDPSDEAGEHDAAVELLRVKYPQYRGHSLERRPVLRFAVERAVSWGDLAPGTGPAHGAAGSGSSSSPGGSRPR